jgi:hypothetical protein
LLPYRNGFNSNADSQSTATADGIIAGYLSGAAASFSDLSAYRQIKKLFLELNSALPASAACERLFSVAGRIFVPNRSRITDEHFEQPLLLRVNRNVGALARK